MKKSSAKIGSLIIALLLIAAGTLLAFGGSFGTGYANADKYTAGDTTVSRTVENLDIHWVSGAVNVEYYDGSDIRVSETASRNLPDNDKLQWWLDGNTLRIQFAKPGIRLFSFNLNKTLTVSLPKELSLKNASIEVTSADVNAENLEAEELKMNSTSGSLLVNGRVKKLAAGSTSGNIIFRGRDRMDTAVLSSTSGDVSMTAEDADTVSITATSGSIMMSSTSTVSDLTLHTTSGSITGRCALKRGAISSTSGSTDVTFTAFENLTIDATSGDVRAALPETPGFSCEIETTSGAVNTAMPVEKNGKTYSCGDGSAKCRINTTSGDVLISRAE